MSEDDQRAFREAMNGVRRLPARDAVASAPRPRAGARLAGAGQRAELAESPLPPADPAALDPAGRLAFRRAGVRDDVLRRLRRGQYAVAAEIDLHGLGRHAAHEALRQFVGESAAQGHGCVRVIHGKGRGSGPRGPILKQLVDYWLRHMDDVVAFASPPPADGGTGAVHVLLGMVHAGRGAGGRARR